MLDYKEVLQLNRYIPTTSTNIAYSSGTLLVHQFCPARCQAIHGLFEGIASSVVLLTHGCTRLWCLKSACRVPLTVML